MTARVRALLIVLIISLLSVSSRAAATQPAFALRGIKGLWWDGLDKYRLALPWVAEHNMNFLMFCYSSFPASGKDWRADYSAEEQAGFHELAQQADKLGVELCLSFNPGIWSNPPLTYASEEDYQLAWKKVQAVHALGIHSFALCLDDINTKLQPADAQRFKNLQTAQVYFVNRLWNDMKMLSPRPRFIFCPSAYTTGEAEKHLDYIKRIADLDPAIFVFWTGPGVCSPTITAKDAEQFAAWVGRKPIIWDNYPVNDMFPWRPLLAPIKGRSPDLGAAVAGLMANPMKQWEPSKLPLATLAMYLNDPANYDPATAKAKLLESYPAPQQPIIEALLNVYGKTFLGERGYPPAPDADVKLAAEELPKYQMLKQQLSQSKELASLQADIQPTLDSDIKTLERLTRDRQKKSPLSAEGSDFTGGAADLFGWSKYDRDVNYVYAKPTKRDTMRVSFWLADDRRSSADAIRITARNDDSGKPIKIRIAWNDHVLFEGLSDFKSDQFSDKTFPIESSSIRPGENILTIQNIESDGTLGMPPWFMVAQAEFVSRSR